MADLTGVQLTRAEGLLNLQEPIETGPSGLVTTGPAPAQGTGALDTSYRLLSLQQLEALGFDEDYDTTNNVLVWHQVQRYFNLTSSPLWLRVAAQSVTLTDLLTPANTHAATLLEDADGEIRQLAATRNPDDTYTPTVTNGIDEDVVSAITQAIALRDQVIQSFRPSVFWIEGRAFDGAAASVVDLRATGANEIDGDFISVALNTDPAWWSKFSQNSNILDAADVGTALGRESAAPISEHIGRVSDAGDVSDPAKGFYDTIGFAGGHSVADIGDTGRIALASKGFVFLRRYPRQAGVYFEQDPCANPVSDDFFNRRFSRVWVEAYLRLYDALVDEVKRKLPEEGGQIEDSTQAYLQSVASRGLQVLQEAGHINGYAITIDPVLQVDGALRIVDFEFRIQPINTADVLRGKLGLSAA